MTAHSINASANAATVDSGQPPASIPYDWPWREYSRFVNAGGIRWHVQRCGVGPKLLLVHGTGASTHSWRDVLPLLAGHFEVLAIDLPGHGFTDSVGNANMTLNDIAASLGALLDKLDFAPDYVVGHSAGAAILLRMALDESIKPQRIVGLNAALLPFGGSFRRFFTPLAQFLAGTRTMPRMIAARARDLAAVRRVLAGTGSHLDRQGVEYYQRLLTREQHVAAVLAMMANWNLDPMLDDLPRLPTELHLVTASGDKAVSAREAQAIVRRLPTTTVTQLEGCGHLAHEEQPDRLASLLVDLCQPATEQRHADD